MSENLKKLEELTLKLPSLVAHHTTNVDMVTYLSRDGGSACLGFRLWSEPGVAVQRSFLPRGCVLDDHHHDEKEILVVYSGRMNVVFKDRTVSLSASDVLEIPPLSTHRAEAVEDTWCIGITIPAAEGYP
jgi:quercetin dioxygenase-like cupin family protein